MKLGPYNTDASMTLEQLTGVDWGDPKDAPTNMVETLIQAGKKPLLDLDFEEARLLISQEQGLPFILDYVWPVLQKNPLEAFDLYDGDVLALLIKAPISIWAKRPEYLSELETLKERALASPDYINDMFKEVLEQELKD